MNINEFLKLQNEEAISRFENILNSLKKVSEEQIFEPMSYDELNKRIDKSESDFQNNRFKTSSQLLTKF